MTQFLNLDGLKYYHSKIKAYVDGKVSDLEGALKYEGTIGSTGATITALPTAATANKGYVYIVKTAGTYVGANEVGDLLISNGVEWTAVNGENQVSDNNPTLAWGTKSKVGTIDGVDLNVTMPANPNTDTKVTSVANHYTPSGGSDGVTLSGTIGLGDSSPVVTGIVKDAAGHIVSASAKTITIPTVPTSLPTSDTFVLNAPAATSGNATITFAKNSTVANTIAVKPGTDISVVTSPENTITITHTVGAGTALTNGGTIGSSDIVPTGITKDSLGHIVAVTGKVLPTTAFANDDHYLTKLTAASATGGVTITPTMNSGTATGATIANATATTNGAMSSTDYTKLNGIATGAEVNQNAFSNVSANGTTLSATTKTDTLTVTAGTNITVTGSGKALTIATTATADSSLEHTQIDTVFLTVDDVTTDSDTTTYNQYI